MTIRILHAVRRTCVDERAIALPMALGMMLALSIALVTVLTFSSSSERHSELGKAQQVALAVAEAGLNEAQSVLMNSTNPLDPGVLPSSSSPGTVAVEGETAQYWGSLDGNLVWTITAVSSVRNPTGGSALSHTVTSQIEVLASTEPDNEVWKYVYSDAPGCTVFQNVVQVSAPIYTKGDLCLKNDAAVFSPQIDTYGGIQLENNGRVGTSPSDPSDPAVRSRLGCRFGSSGSFDAACSDASYAVYRSSFSNSAPFHTKPPFDAGKRNTAKPGPLHPCTVSTGSVPSFTTTSTINLMPSPSVLNPVPSYTCKVLTGSNVEGELSWNHVAKVLTIKGTIWFDGELMLTGNQQATYDGSATIYFAKKATIKDNVRLCAISASCETSGWDPNVELLALVNGASDIPSFELQNEAKFQGAIYTAGGFKLQNNATMHGPVIASALDVQNNGMPASWPQLTTVLNGMPQNSTGTYVVEPVAESWRG
jgi:Tfp pilus assembly protein PilX